MKTGLSTFLFVIGLGSVLGPPAVAADDSTAALPGEVLINEVEFLRIPAGWFYKSGGVPDPELKPQPQQESGGYVKIWLDDFYIAKYEARARHFTDYLNKAMPSGLATYGGNTEGCSVRQGEGGDFVLVSPAQDLPATHMSWVLADGFATWMGFRLPSEAEWEKAASGGDKRLYPWGDDYPDETYAGFDQSFSCAVRPVDHFKKGVSPYGVFNMAGNVREFVADWFSESFDSAQKDGMKNPPLPPESSSKRTDVPHPSKMLKGGRWASGSNGILISSRVYYHPDQPFRCNGTRFALDAAEVIQRVNAGTAQVVRW